MGKFYDRMDSDLRLARYSEDTYKQYLDHAKRFVGHFMKPPDELGEAEIREYLHYLVDVRIVSPHTQKMALAAIKFLYRRTLGEEEKVDRIPWPKIPEKLPEILTHQELVRLFAMARSTRDRASFMVAYGSGLRVSEVCRLRVEDVDSERGVLHVQEGKGKKSRLTLLSGRLLTELREYWRLCRPSGPWLFDGMKKDSHIGRAALQSAFRKAAHYAKIKRQVTFHSLRHAFGTYLLEAGEDVRVIQALMGHKNLKTTTRYTQVRADLIRKVPCLLDLLDKTPSGHSR